MYFFYKLLACHFKQIFKIICRHFRKSFSNIVKYRYWNKLQLKLIYFYICWLKLGETIVLAELCFREISFHLNMLQIAIGSCIKFLLPVPCFTHQSIFDSYSGFRYLTRPSQKIWLMKFTKKGIQTEYRKFNKNLIKLHLKDLTYNT